MSKLGSQISIKIGYLTLNSRIRDRLLERTARFDRDGVLEVKVLRPLVSVTQPLSFGGIEQREIRRALDE